MRVARRSLHRSAERRPPVVALALTTLLRARRSSIDRSLARSLARSFAARVGRSASHAAAGAQAFRPRYLPIDEAHPPLPHESYGLSKLVGEQVGQLGADGGSGRSAVPSARPLGPSLISLGRGGGRLLCPRRAAARAPSLVSLGRGGGRLLCPWRAAARGPWRISLGRWGGSRLLSPRRGPLLIALTHSTRTTLEMAPRVAAAGRRAGGLGARRRRRRGCPLSRGGRCGLRCGPSSCLVSSASTGRDRRAPEPRRAPRRGHRRCRRASQVLDAAARTARRTSFVSLRFTNIVKVRGVRGRRGARQSSERRRGVPI